MRNAEASRGGLVVSDLTVRYGGVVANEAVSISVAPGEVLGLIGPNGAGKTTFVDAVSGFAAPASGSVVLDGMPIDGWQAHRRRLLGLSRTWQAGELFGNLSVSDNIRVAMAPGGLRSVWRDLVSRESDDDRLDRALDAVGLTTYPDHVAGDLPLGKQKLVGVARAIVGQCSLLMLDEPAAGLGPDETAELGQQIRALADGGLGILLIDHDMSLVLSISDRVTVLQFGKVIYSGPPDEASNDPLVIEAYLGQSIEPDEGE